MAYSLLFKPVTLRQLESLPREVQRRVAVKIEMLREDPYSPRLQTLDRTGRYLENQNR